MGLNHRLAIKRLMILFAVLFVHAEMPFAADDLSQQYAPQQYAPQQYAPQQYAPQQYAPQQYAPQQYAPQQYAPQQPAPQQYGYQQYEIEIGNGTAPAPSESAPFAVKDTGAMPTAPAQPSTFTGQQPASQMIAPRTVPGSIPKNGAQPAPLKPGVQPASKPAPGTAEPETAFPAGAESAVSTSPVGARNVKGFELSPIERAMTEPDVGTYKFSPQFFRVQNLRQFGYSFFRSEARGFAPLTDIPVGPDYVLGAGDHIALTVWGSIEGHYDLEVSRSGEIVLPKVGAVKVAGVTFGQLPKFLNGQLAKVFRDFQLNVTMGKLRLIKVFLVGEVSAPGDYNVSSLSTLINALSAAGGPTRNGSLRAIAIKREGKLVETVDLYDFFLRGDKSRDIRLQPGDTVFVPSIGPVAGIAGNVRRPAIYELKNEKTLKELLDLADGIIPTGYLQRLQISRVEAHDKKVITDVSLDPKENKTLEDRAASIPIKDQDLVKIFPIDRKLRGYARLEGYVLRPGDYALQPGMRVHQLLQQDNILPETSMEVAEVTRLYPPDLHPEKIVFRPGKALAGEPADDLELQEFDQVRIFSRWELEEMPKVRVSGEVQKPGEYRLMKNMRVTDLLINAGYPKNSAYLKSAEISRLKQTASTVISFPVLIDLEEAIKGNPQHNIPLEPFDELTVRKIPNWSEESERYITLKGEFRFPGVYPVFKGEKLSSVIRRAGGFSERAYLRAAKFTREAVREIQQKRMDEFIATTEQDMNRRMTEVASTASTPEELASAKAVLEGVKSNLQLLKAAKAEGRMVIKLAPLDKFTNSSYDIAAMGGDVLEVPQRSYSVSVLGKVVNPTNFVASFERPVGYYLENAGGMTGDSDESEIYVIRADGSVFSRQQYSSMASIFGGGFMNEPVESGDAIVVPQKFEKTAWLRTIKDITTIMSQIAITAGTVFLGLR